MTDDDDDDDDDDAGVDDDGKSDLQLDYKIAHSSIFEPTTGLTHYSS